MTAEPFLSSEASDPAPEPAGTSRMRRLLDEWDWSATALGPRSTWPVALHVMIETALDSEFPLQLAWGPDLLVLYNEAYIPVLGEERHPWALGRPASEVWPELWPTSEPLARQVMATGVGYHSDDQRIILNRNGHLEEAYFTFSQSPLRDADGTIVGLFNAITESTAHLLLERRLRVLRELGSIGVDTGGSVGAVYDAALRVLARTRESVPFACVYEPDAAGGARRVGGYGFDDTAADACDVVAARVGPDSPVGVVLATGQRELVDGLRDRHASVLLPGPLGPAIPDQAVVLPIITTARAEPMAALVIGVNAYHRADGAYLGFAWLAARQLGTAVNDTLAVRLAIERNRALAELDRVKTEFFQNVSHDLRTPLTLLLGPLADALADQENPLPATARDTLDAGLRAARRLAKMVDALLDFSRAEAGALLPDRVFLDLVEATREAVATVRPVAEAKDLTLQLDLSADPVIAAVDRGMWTSIVTNLVDNAVKYTERGGITVTLGTEGPDGMATLAVSDTGVGIPESEHAQVFDRFHRVRRSGADEQPAGVGIGLALVADLVKAHDGSIAVSSAPGSGSTFTVSVPLSAPGAHTTALSPAAALPNSEVARSTAPEPVDPEPGPGPAPRVLVVEDDLDLRTYLSKIFARDGWQVVAARDAESAKLVFDDPDGLPDVVVTDVMLPGQSGLDLLAQLRADPALARAPVIVLTARAGPAAAVEALATGADDFVTKPFDAAELVARVRAHHEMNQLRESAIGVAESRAAGMRQALESNRTIGTAVGIVMGQFGLDASTAFDVLVRHSQQGNRKLRDIAREVVGSGRLDAGAVARP